MLWWGSDIHTLLWPNYRAMFVKPLPPFRPFSSFLLSLPSIIFSLLSHVVLSTEKNKASSLDPWLLNQPLWGDSWRFNNHSFLFQLCMGEPIGSSGLPKYVAVAWLLQNVIKRNVTQLGAQVTETWISVTSKYGMWQSCLEVEDSLIVLLCTKCRIAKRLLRIKVRADLVSRLSVGGERVWYVLYCSGDNYDTCAVDIRLFFSLAIKSLGTR